MSMALVMPCACLRRFRNQLLQRTSCRDAVGLCPAYCWLLKMQMRELEAGSDSRPGRLARAVLALRLV